MTEKRTIKARRIVKDIRAGLTNEEIMEKRELSGEELVYVLQKLRETGLLTDEDIVHRLPPSLQTTTASRVRAEPRCYLFVGLPVYLANDVTVEGFVLDISEGGLKTVGIPALVGEIKALLIRPDEYQDIYPFSLDAQCRWVKPADEPEDIIAGFEIVRISETGVNELKKLLQFLCLPDAD